ncbi:MAG: NAD(P)-dependent alcohol dehydrogenase [Burkholderiaceae bacterium]
MKAWVQRGPGMAGLVFDEVADAPAPGHGQVQVRLRAAALNPRDLQVLGGQYGSMTKADLVPGSDGSGEVASVGPGVWRVAAGDRVALTFHPHKIGDPHEATPSPLGRGGSVDGVLQQHCTVGQDEVVPLPEHLSFEEGATLPCAALTAWAALTAGASLLPGDSVLVQGTGGVSLFALQLARLFGSRVIALASSADKARQLVALGAHDVIDRHDTPQWHEAVCALTEGRGVHRVVDVGGAATVAQSVQSLREGGTLAVVGLLGGPPAFDFGFFMRGVDVHPVRVGTRDQFVRMNHAIAQHRLRPVIARRYAFSELQQALRDLAAQQHVGKLVVSMND